MVRKNKHVVKSAVRGALHRKQAEPSGQSNLDRRLCRLIDMMCNACWR